MKSRDFGVDATSLLRNSKIRQPDLSPRVPDRPRMVAGFSCPYCNASSFVSCSGGHLYCDGTTQLRNGRRFHQSFCGNAAFISDTPMKTFESKRLSVDRDEVSPKPSRARPPTAKQQISRCDPSTPNTWHSGEVVSVASARRASRYRAPLKLSYLKASAAFASFRSSCRILR